MTTQPNTGAAVDPAAGGQAPGSNKTPANPAASPGAGGAAAGGSAPASATTQVPLDVVTSLRDELKAAKQSNDVLQSQIQIYQANQHFQPAAGAPAPASAAPPDPLEAVSNLADTDVVTVKELKKIVTGITAGGGAGSPQLEQRLARIEVQSMDPTYEQTIRTYLPEMVSQNPGIIQVVQGSPNPLAAALTYARLNPRFMQAQNAPAGGTPNPGADPNPANPGTVPINPQVNIIDQIDQIIANSNKPGSPDQVGGQGAISQADRFSSMTDAEFDAHLNKVMAGQT